MKIQLWIVPLLFFLVGAAFTGVAAFLFYQQTQLEQHGISATGRVIELIPSTNEEGNTTYAPLIRFALKNGRQYDFQSTYYAHPPNYEVGQSVTILYPPDQPEKASIQGEDKWFILIFGILGPALIVISAVIARALGMAASTADRKGWN